MNEDVRVSSGVTIPADELQMRFSTSGGPGGQHANKTSTRVDLSWNVRSSRALGPVQRDRLLSGLAHRIDSSGNLRVSSDAYRSQLRNREEAVRRLARLVAEALRPAKARVETAPTKSSHERRLKDKQRRGAVKRARRPPEELE